MRVHHLNCGTMRTVGTPDGLVCHVLVIETEQGLVLVDSGMGLRDAADPAGRFGAARFYVRPAFDEAEAAVRQLPALGLDPRDVRHIILTHSDSDHTGGIADFPWARIHLTAAENQAAVHPRGIKQRGRYPRSHRTHDPDIVEHTPAQSESWNGFPGALELSDIASGLVLIALPGHTVGHAAVAVEADHGWVFHVGDCFYHHGQIDGTGNVPRALTLMERVMAEDWATVTANHARLTEVWDTQGDDLTLVNAHDPTLLARARTRSLR